MDGQGAMPAGWYHGEGDPPGTKRYWDGSAWTGEPTVMSDTPASGDAAGSSLGTHDAGMVPASSGKRLGARFIDALIFGIPLQLANQGYLDTQEFSDMVDAGESPGLDVLFGGVPTWVWLLPALVWVIETVMVALLGATPGKLLLGTRIASSATRSTPPSWATAALRTALRLLGILFLISVGIGFAAAALGILVSLASLILIFTDDRHQTVMDKIAKTVVIEKP